MQVAQRQPGVDAQLVAERAVQLAVHGEGICLPAAAVEREHQLRVQLLVVRVVLDQPVQFRYEPSVLAEGQPGLDQRPGGLQPEPAQPLGVLVQPGAPGEVGEVRQRLAPPEPERCAQVALTVDWVRRHGGVADQAFGGLHVGDLGADIEHVARRPVADRGPAAQDLPEVGHMALHGVQRGRRRGVAPDRVDQPVGADDLTRVQGQHRQHRDAA